MSLYLVKTKSHTGAEIVVSRHRTIEAAYRSYFRVKRSDEKTMQTGSYMPALWVEDEARGEAAHQSPSRAAK